MARTDSQHLSKLLDIRDELADAIETHDGRSPVTVTIRGRTVTYSDPWAALDRLEKQIDKYKSKSATGPARNRVNLKRPS